LITRTIFGDQYRLLSSSLCSLLHAPVTSSLLGPNNVSGQTCKCTPSRLVLHVSVLRRKPSNHMCVMQRISLGMFLNSLLNHITAVRCQYD
jgi:hypothetical protein